MTTLHTVNKSPFEKNSLQSCLRVARPGAALLLMEDAVYGALQGTAVESMMQKAVHSLRVFALSPDLLARGLIHRPMVEGVVIIDYEGFVDLAVENDRVQAWL